MILFLLHQGTTLPFSLIFYFFLFLFITFSVSSSVLFLSLFGTSVCVRYANGAV